MQHRWTRSFQNVALIAGSLIFFLLMIELVGRVFGLLPTPERMHQFSPTKGYELRPGHENINSHGMRDREYPVAKPRHTFRILAIGDSFTYGQGVAQAETYAKRLEAMLNERLGDRGIHFEVLNAGVRGYNTHQEMIHLQEIGLQFDPDLILVGFVLNDAELGHLGLKDVRSGLWLIRVKEWMKHNMVSYRFLRNQVKRLIERFKGRGGSSVAPLRLAAKRKPSPGWDLCRKSLKSIAAIAKVRNIPAMLVIFPYLYDLDDTYPFKGEHALVAKSGRESGMKVLDLLPEFMGLEPSALWVSPTDGHPNATGHLIAAEEIYKAMLSQALEVRR